MAVYFYNYSTWLAKPGLYLEDLYTCPQSFAVKVAGKRLLLKKMAQIALEKGCGRFEWSCLDWNKPSRDFYEVDWCGGPRRVGWLPNVWSNTW